MADESQAIPQGAGFRFRDTTRAPFTTTVRLRFDRLGSTVEAQSADISMEGMFVKTEEPRPVGTLVQFEFDVDAAEDEAGESAAASQEVVQGLGDVVWVRATGGPTKPPGMGIQFRYVDAQSREHVYRIVKNFIRQISGEGAGVSVPQAGRASDRDGLESVAPPPPAPASAGAGDSTIGNATVAAPLSALPGWSQASEAGAHEEGSLLSGLESEESQQGDGSIDSLDSARPEEVSSGVTTSSPATLGTPSTDAPPPPPGSFGAADPFGGLLKSEGSQSAEPPPLSSPEGAGPFDSLTSGGGVSSPPQNSGSFSLSVPRIEERPAVPSAPPSSGEPGAGTSSDREAPGGAISESAPPPPASPAAGSATAVDTQSGAATEATLDSSGAAFAEELARPSFEGESLMPVEPYSPDDEPDAEGGGYYGSTAKAKRGSSFGLLALLLIGALAVAAYFTKPWQYIAAQFGNGSAQLATGEPEVSVGFEQPAPEAEGELESIPNELADGTAATTDPSSGGATEAPATGVAQSGATEASAVREAESASPPARPDPSAGETVGTPASSPATPSTGARPSTPVTRLVDFATADFSDRTQVRIVGDGQITSSDFEAVRLTNPPRFLIKIRGVGQSLRLDESSSRFESVRTGLHQVSGRPELHVVFDMTRGDFTADVRLDEGELLVSFR